MRLSDDMHAPDMYNNEKKMEKNMQIDSVCDSGSFVHILSFNVALSCCAMLGHIEWCIERL